MMKKHRRNNKGVKKNVLSCSVVAVVVVDSKFVHLLDKSIFFVVASKYLVVHFLLVFDLFDLSKRDFGKFP